MNLTTAHSHLVCVYCDSTVFLDETYCYRCNEYKGLMTVEAYEDYLNVKMDCSCLEANNV